MYHYGESDLNLLYDELCFHVVLSEPRHCKLLLLHKLAANMFDQLQVRETYINWYVFIVGCLICRAVYVYTVLQGCVCIYCLELWTRVSRVGGDERFAILWSTSVDQALYITPHWGAVDAEIKVPSESLNVLRLKPGQYIAIHATLSDRDFFLAYFYPSGPFTCIFFPNRSLFFLCWLWLTHGSCIGPQNKIGHPAGGRFPCWVPAEYK